MDRRELKIIMGTYMERPEITSSHPGTEDGPANKWDSHSIVSGLHFRAA